ncbi:MAG: ribosome rescue GTPase HflX [Pseudomonadota bacterium]
MFDRHSSSDRAVLVHIGIGQRPLERDTNEFRELAHSSGASVLATVSGSRGAPEPRYFVGRGKADEIRALVATHDAGLVMFNHAISPSQERNLEKLLQCRVIDRAGLILDIFSQRARSFEGKLQVELAQLRHLSTRLVRGWTHLERQKGGIGLRGPGETQLELDRRLIGGRIKALETRLEKLDRQRAQGRRFRRRAERPVVSLVGYTNAGKSTLFNTLTGADAYVQDQLFATLDPTLRRLDLPRGVQAIAADTVGFVRDLPHELVAAFRSTLQETTQAALLLHVIDVSDPERAEHTAEVDDVLAQIGAGEVPRVKVYNKIDRLTAESREALPDGAGSACVSAVTGEGVDALLQLIEARVAGKRQRGILSLGPGEGRVRARLYDAAAVRHETPGDDGGWRLDLDVDDRDLARLERREGIALRRRITQSTRL